MTFDLVVFLRVPWCKKENILYTINNKINDTTKYSYMTNPPNDNLVTRVDPSLRGPIRTRCDIEAIFIFIEMNGAPFPVYSVLL